MTPSLFRIQILKIIGLALTVQTCFMGIGEVRAEGVEARPYNKNGIWYASQPSQLSEEDKAAAKKISEEKRHKIKTLKALRSFFLNYLLMSRIRIESYIYCLEEHPESSYYRRILLDGSTESPREPMFSSRETCKERIADISSKIFYGYTEMRVQLALASRPAILKLLDDQYLSLFNMKEESDWSVYLRFDPRPEHLYVGLPGIEPLSPQEREDAEVIYEDFAQSKRSSGNIIDEKMEVLTEALKSIKGRSLRENLNSLKGLSFTEKLKAIDAVISVNHVGEFLGIGFIKYMQSVFDWIFTEYEYGEERKALYEAEIEKIPVMAFLREKLPEVLDRPAKKQLREAYVNLLQVNCHTLVRQMITPSIRRRLNQEALDRGIILSKPKLNGGNNDPIAQIFRPETILCPEDPSKLRDLDWEKYSFLTGYRALLDRAYRHEMYMIYQSKETLIENCKANTKRLDDRNGEEGLSIDWSLFTPEARAFINSGLDENVDVCDGILEGSQEEERIAELLVSQPDHDLGERHRPLELPDEDELTYDELKGYAKFSPVLEALIENPNFSQDKEWLMELHDDLETKQAIGDGAAAVGVMAASFACAATVKKIFPVAKLVPKGFFKKTKKFMMKDGGNLCHFSFGLLGDIAFMKMESDRQWESFHEYFGSPEAGYLLISSEQMASSRTAYLLEKFMFSTLTVVGGTKTAFGLAKSFAKTGKVQKVGKNLNKNTRAFKKAKKAKSQAKRQRRNQRQKEERQKAEAEKNKNTQI